jgi:hypothetical protein
MLETMETCAFSPSTLLRVLSMAKARSLLLGLLAATFTVVAAKAQSGEASRNNSDCFLRDQFEDWRSPDPGTIYIRVMPGRYYRLDVAGQCSRLKSPQSHLIANSRGKATICSPLDWDIRVSEPNGGGEQQCIVRAMTRLDPAQVAAIPQRFKP